MADRKPRFRSLTFTVNLFLVLALAAGVGVVMAVFTLSLLSSRDQLTRNSLLQQGNIIYTSIANFMLPGDAPLAVKFVDQIALASPGSSISLYRRDGVPAFSDNSTIQRVNSNLKQAKFASRLQSVPLQPGPGKPRFDEATANPPQEVFFSEGSGGRSYFRAYRPLINLPKCSVCHGGDHTVRGVIDIRSDVTDVIRTQNLTIAGGAGGFFLVVGLLAFFIGTFLRSLVLSPIQAIGSLCAQVTSGSFEGRVDVRGKNEIGELARTVNQMVGGLRERFELTKYVSRGTIGALTEGQRPQRVERTLLFTDVRGFTAYTEKVDPEQVVEALNRLLERQSEIIHEWGGDIDKFVGDEVVSVFAGEGAAARACGAAVAIVRLCESRKLDFDGLQVGLGAATGAIIQGMIGSERRADFTVIGDSVNVASRLCSIAKAGQVIVSDATKTAAGTEFSFKGPFGAKLKGKAAPQKVWILETAERSSAGGEL
jgi:class 3 adenylate cyclase